MEIKFKQEFLNQVLDRGYEYYVNGAVDDIEIQNGNYHAMVCGSEDYEVNIYTKDGMILHMDCTCPYAQENTCKHEAALLYAITDEKYEQDIASSPANEEDEQILQKITKEQLDAFILQKLMSDHVFRMDFESNFRQFYALRVESYVNEWRKILCGAMERHGFIFYNQTSEFESMVLALIYKLKKEVSVYPWNVFSICTTIYEELIDLPIDDSNGTITSIASQLREMMRSCITYGDEHVIEAITIWLNQASDNQDFNNFGLEEGLDDLYLETLPLPKQIAYLKENLYYDYQIEKLISLFIEQKETEATIYQELQPYLHITAARDWAIKYYLKHEHINEAIQLLNDTIETASHCNKASYERKLIHIYEQYHYDEDYHRSVRQYLEERTYQAMVLYNEYKEHFQSKDWNIIKSEIIEHLANVELKAEAYFIENMKEELLIILEKNRFSIHQIITYEEILKDIYEDRLLEIYLQCILSLCDRANNACYQEIYCIFMHMLTLPNGTPVVKNLTMELMREYKRRKNLMTLLKTLPIFA